MSYKCLDCGHIFECGEETYHTESRGEYWGSPCSVTISGCPFCGGDYQESIPCQICGKENLEDELHGGVCEECLEKYRYDVELCNNIGKKDDETIKLNCFLASMFDKEEIELILFEELKKVQKYTKVDCGKFIFDADTDWFAERLVEEVKKG